MLNLVVDVLARRGLVVDALGVHHQLQELVVDSVGHRVGMCLGDGQMQWQGPIVESVVVEEREWMLQWLNMNDSQ